ncbi:hypothetical protein MBLNU230_g4138t1 [Neophaeotheca triangularis]
MADPRETLRSAFLDQPPEKLAGKWDDMWRSKVTPWDRDLPNPALVDILAGGMLGSPITNDGQRKRALVPGCGKGYDVLLFASHGYDAYGLDVSETALEEAGNVRQRDADDETKYPMRAPKSKGRGETEFLMADFFNDSFLEKTQGSSFDIIYDYTFLCALPPALRPQWARRMSSLLSPNGRLVCLEFPLHKDPKMGGPPFGLQSNLYEALLKAPGEAVEYDEAGKPSKEPENVGKGSLMRIEHWKPERTHKVGEGTDMVSIWKHRATEKVR